MKKIAKWFKRNRDSIIKNSFLLPILLVVVMSINHVISWYKLGNPISWAIYLSIAIEIFALASVAAASINIKKGSIWFLFGLVTFIQVIGNIFFEYQYINVNDPTFLSWVEMIKPAFLDWNVIDHKRLLAIIQGGTLPIMSLTSLHFFIKFTEKEKIDNVSIPSENNEPIIEKEYRDENGDIDWNKFKKDYDKEKNIPTKDWNELTNEEKEDLDSHIKGDINDYNEDNKTKDREIEPIDEDAFLKEKEESKESSNLTTSSNTKISNDLGELEKHENSKLKEEKTKEKPKPKEEDSFGPPNINN